MLLEYALTTDDYVAFNEHAARTSPTIRKQQAQFRVVAAVACLPLALLLVGVMRSDWTGAFVVGPIAAVAMWFAFPRINWWLAARTLRRLAANGDAGPLGPVHLSLDDRGITENLAGTTTAVTWEGIDRVTESDDHYFVFTAPLAGLIVPKRALSSAELIDAVRHQVAARTR